MLQRIALCQYALDKGEFAEGKTLARLAAKALQETLEGAPWPNASALTICRVLEVFGVLASTARTWSRVGDSTFESELDGTQSKALLEEFTSSAPTKRWVVPQPCVDADYTLELGWYSYGGLDLIWAARAVMQTSKPGWMPEWCSTVGTLAPRDFRAFLGRFAECSSSFKIPFVHLSCAQVVDALEIVGFALNAPPEVERSREWRAEANAVVRALEARAFILASFEHDPALVGDTYALADMFGGDRDSAQRTRDLSRLTEEWEAREKLKFVQQERIALEREGAVELDDSDKTKRTKPVKRKPLDETEDHTLKKLWIQRAMQDDLEEEDPQKEDEDEEAKWAALARTQEKKKKAKPLELPRARVGMRFITEVRTLAGHVIRLLAESDAVQVVYPQLTKEDDLVLNELRVWMTEGMSAMNATHTRNAFRTFVAERLLHPGNFVQDSIRNPLVPARSATDLMARRGDVAGDVGDHAVAVLPRNTESYAKGALKFPRDFADFALHRLTSQMGQGGSVYQALVGKFPPKASWFENGNQKAYWDGARGAYVFRQKDGALWGFASLTEGVVYLVRRDRMPLHTPKYDLRSIENVLKG